MIVILWQGCLATSNSQNEKKGWTTEKIYFHALYTSYWGDNMHDIEVYVKVVVMIIFCWQFHTCSQLVFLLDLFWLKSLTFPSITLYNRFLSTTKHFRCQSWRTSSTLQTQYQARRSMINHSSSHVCVGEGSLQHFFLLILVETLRSYKWTDPVRV
jgi:hypothetical protein